MERVLENERLKVGMFVKYNGGTDNYVFSNNPSNLIENKIYQVGSVDIMQFQTNISLQGIAGKFNSVWFDAVSLPTYFALASTLPIVGGYLESFSRYQGSTWVPCRKSSAVKEILQISDKFYKIVTINTIYIVQIV